MSGFEESRTLEESAGIDFRKAKKLLTTGTICDAYETRHYRRHVFIKRLKSEFRKSPRHLAALEKEYEIGVNLNHPGLPHYTEFHDDYIIMDFIDGQTLASMIAKQDSRLQNPEFVIKILSVLLELLEYLHGHNVYHNDIKADNIIITYQSGNPVLIDFDKCYTSWWDDTPGASDLYGVPAEKTGSPEVDFHGLGRIVQKLSEFSINVEFKNFLQNFSKICFSEDVSVLDLRALLKGDNETSSIPFKNELKEIAKSHIRNGFSLPSLRTRYIMGACGAFILMLFVFVTQLLINKSHTYQTLSEKVIESTDSLQESMPAAFPANIPETIPGNIYTNENIVDDSRQHQRQIPAEAEINQYLTSAFESLNPMLSNFNSMIDNTDVKESDIVGYFMKITDKQSLITQDAYKYFEDHYPDVNPVDIQLAVVSSKKYREISEEITRLSNLMVKLQEQSVED